MAGDRLDRPLTELARRFIDEWLIELAKADGRPNQTAAAIRAGYAPASAKVSASRNLADPRVIAIVEDRQRQLRDAVQVKREDIVEELRRVGFAQLRDVVSWGPDGIDVIDSEELTPEVAAAVAQVEMTETEIPRGDLEPIIKRRVKLKMHPKLDALMGLVRVLGLEPRQEAPKGSVAGVQIIIAGGPTGLEVKAVAAAGSGGELPPPPQVLIGGPHVDD